EWNPSTAAPVLREIEPVKENIRLALFTIAQTQHEGLVGSLERLTTIAVAAMSLVILVMIITFFLSIHVVRQVYRTVIEPVELLVESATLLALGKLREDVPLSSQDELGRLGKAINQLRVSLALSEMKYRSLFAN